MAFKSPHHNPEHKLMESQLIQARKSLGHEFITELNISDFARPTIIDDFEVTETPVWDDKQASRFIESKLLGIYDMDLAVVNEGLGHKKSALVRGNQAFIAFQRFACGEFVLQDMRVLTQLYGRSYNDLPFEITSHANLWCVHYICTDNDIIANLRDAPRK